jgi:primosomal protein N' (replication factor Y)
MVFDLPPLNLNLVKLGRWLVEYYPAPIGFIAKQFLPRTINPEYIKDFKGVEHPKHTSKLPKLTKEQAEVVEAIDPDQPNTYLLHGKTGSGKTRVYIELAKSQLEKQKSVIILTPEISLTSQLAETFRQTFGDQVLLFHSKQSPKERQTTWLKCLVAKQPLIILGPRSAVFSPLQNLGLIVIDESHEPAYKQDQSPHYLTTRVASHLSALSRSILVLGSATPSISDYFLALSKNKPILSMTSLASTKDEIKNNVKIIDLKDKDNFTSSPVLSNQLISSIKQSLENHEQSLLYLNRRGTSRLVLCTVCGWEMVCPNCNLPLVYHGDKHELRCHSCSYKHSTIPTACPVCGNDSILFKTMGTKAVYEELTKLFVNANIARFDTDNLKAESLDQRYSAIKDGSIDILVGTQQLAKGLDLPKLSTVGVLQADTNLYLPDFSSLERSFQLITQVLGRINRGHVAGRAFVQTYNPGSELIKSSVDQNYKEFYDDEIVQREKYKFPPFYYLMKLSIKRATTNKAETDAKKLKSEIESHNIRVIVEGPTPAFHEKFNNKFEWQLVVKTTKRSELLSVIGMLPSPWTYDIDPINLL